METTVPRPIYLDFNASTPVAPEVADAMRPLPDAYYGNPSSAHWAGHSAHTVLAAARGQVAALLGCAPDEIVFTRRDRLWTQLREAFGAAVELSPVLAPMGVPLEVGMGAIRFSVGRGTTDAEIEDIVDRLRGVRRGRATA